MNEPNNPIDTNAVRQVILDAVRLHAGTASFVDLEKAMSEAGIDYAGDYVHMLDEELALWAGWSDKVFEVLIELIDEDHVHFWPSNLLVYMADGKALKMPIYTSEDAVAGEMQWLPVVIRPGALPENPEQVLDSEFEA